MDFWSLAMPSIGMSAKVRSAARHCCCCNSVAEERRGVGKSTQADSHTSATWPASTNCSAAL
eukprot:1949878-Amphidinium_carterae.1